MSGNRELSPDNLSIDKFNQIFENFKKIISVAVAEQKMGLQDINFRYEKGSATLTSDIPSVAYGLITKEITELRKGHPINPQRLTIPRAILDLKKITNDLSDDAQFTLEGEEGVHIKVTKSTVFEQLKDRFFNSEKIMYGKMLEVGGVKPNIHIRTEDKGDVVVIVGEKQAMELAPSLYEELGIKMSFRQNIISEEVVSAQYISRFPFSRVIDEAKFQRDKDRGKKAWKGIDPVSWEQKQRN